MSYIPQPTKPDPAVAWAIGIDPGATGATVVLSLRDMSWAVLRHSKIPRTPAGHIRTDSYTAMLGPMLSLSPDPASIRAYMEKVMILSGQRAAAKMGINWGKVEGALEGMGIVTEIVPATEWKRGLIPDKAFRDEHGKMASVIAAEALGFSIPTLNAKGVVKDHNVADALLIAIYGARTYLGLSLEVNDGQPA